MNHHTITLLGLVHRKRPFTTAHTESMSLNRSPKNLALAISSRSLPIYQIWCKSVNEGEGAQCYLIIPFLGIHPQDRLVDQFSRLIAQTMQTRAVPIALHLGGQISKKNTILQA